MSNSDYYTTNADEFAKQTVEIDMSSLYARFLPHVLPGGHILDAGCGTGRDARAFLDLGFKVSAFDSSHAMVELAKQKTGLPVRCLSFQDFNDEQCYDGVWACASLLHVSRSYLPEVFIRLKKSLRPKGIIFVSFKLGNFEGNRNGRFFIDLTESSLKTILLATGLQIRETWQTQDLRPGRSSEKWLNGLLEST